MPDLKEHPLIECVPGRCGGDPVIAGTRLRTSVVFANTAGVDTDDHVKMFRKWWPEITPEQVRAAIRFERAQRRIV